MVKVKLPRLRLERVSQGARPFDQRLQPHAVDHPLKGERSVLTLFVIMLVLFEGAGRDGESAHLERDRLAMGMDPGRGAAQDEVGHKVHAILVLLAGQNDRNLHVEGEEMESERRRNAHANGNKRRSTVLVAVSITETVPSLRFAT
jgi:hypothetical protein